LAVAVAAAVAFVPVATAGPRQRASMTTIEAQVMCVTCGIPLEVAQSPQADAERAYIQQLIDRGETDAQIKRALVAQYGPNVLALPRASGFDLAVYIVPIVVVVALLAVVGFLVPRWRRNRSLHVGEPDSGEAAITPAESKRLDRELADF
jgi:cytochrome c-type biogenesis protein CcmH